MALSFTAKKTQIFTPAYAWIANRVKSKRAVVALISFLSGILPISGRVAVSAGALDTLAPKNEKRKNYGVIDYMSTHHFYFWSPLEATVLVPMAALGLSYWEFMGKIWPLLATAIVVILYYIFKVLKEDDIEINISKTKQTSTWKEDRKQIASYAKTILFTAIVIVISNIIKANFELINSWVEGAHRNNLMLLVLFVGFIASFALGSSGKFAGFVALSVSVFGIETLPLFFAVDYAGYMLSPVHKCLVISQSYFGTKISQYYKAVLALVLPIIAVASLVYVGTTS